jgi:hypothetical protein
MSVILPPNNTDVPERYVGAWRKRSNVDHTYWLQTHRLFALVVIPADRPDFSGRQTWADFSDDELMILAHQGGVSGACIAAEDILHRRRQLDYLPQRGQPFLRRMRRDGVQLNDEALDGRHRCIWDLLADADHEIVGLRFHDVEVGSGGDDQCRGYLLVVGPYFMYVRDRFVATQRADSLAVLAELKHFSRRQLIDALDFELSFGRRDGAKPWTVELSTIPFREGRQLMSDEVLRCIIAGANQGPEKIKRAGKTFLRYWTLDEWKKPAGA